MNVTQKLIQSHLVTGSMVACEEIGLKIDQTLTQDATGTLVMLELEAMGLERVKTDLSVQYVDHNLLQEDYKNPDDHLFLESACAHFGLWYSRPGNGVSHPVHMEFFGIPGKTLLGSDSHTPAAGALGMLSFGAGGLEVALAMAGEPYFLKMPQVWGIELQGELPEWVSAKDIILELLRRHNVSGGKGKILEFFGPGLGGLSVWDRHVIANMGTELGAVTTVFPSDQITKHFLKNQNRGEAWIPLESDQDASYDLVETINLSELVPLIAKPTSPGNVVPVQAISGTPLYQAYIGSSANPGYRDMAIAAHMVKGKTIPSHVSFDLNPASRQILETMMHHGILDPLIHAGGRLHQVGCNGCIGMGQAPATGRNSLRTVPRNFPGRSGTIEDSVFLCSPETATASALKGFITDPRDLDIPYVSPVIPKPVPMDPTLFVPPVPLNQAKSTPLIKGPNIESLPVLDPFPDTLTTPIMLKVTDNLSTDEILPAGARVLPYRSNITKLSTFAFDIVDPTYARRARDHHGPHAIVGGDNYGQGSSREHAALVPKFLGLHVVIAKSFARIHVSNLVNFGILPLGFLKDKDYERLNPGDNLSFSDIHQSLKNGPHVQATSSGQTLTFTHSLTSRQIDILLKGGIINWMKRREL